jgi:hypothetical protein
MGLGKQKSRLEPRFLSIQERNELCFGFGHGADALRTQHLLDLAIALINRHLLQVRFELAIGGTH